MDDLICWCFGGEICVFDPFMIAAAPMVLSVLGEWSCVFGYDCFRNESLHS